MRAAFRRVVAAARQAMTPLEVPGAAIGILSDDEQQEAGLGVTSIEHPLDVTAGTLFQIGSITKTVTATAVLRLAEEERLELDAPLRATLAGFRLADETVAERVTLRHLLTHVGGWAGDYFDDPGAGDDALARVVERLHELPQLTPLGALWSYNNAGFYLAGRAVEVATGTTFETAVRELVLDPLGMTQSFFRPEDVLTHRFAVGHRTVDDRVEVARPWALPRSAAPAGGIVAPVSDLLRYARAYLRRGTVLSAESLATMRTRHADVGGMADGMGLTWFLGSVGGVRTIFHGGITNGQVARLTIAPDDAFAVAVVTNHAWGDRVIDDVQAAAFRAFLGAEQAEPAHLARSPEELAEYTGIYSASMTDAELAQEDDRLVLRIRPKGGFPRPDSPPFPAPPPGPLAFYADDAVIVTDGVLRGTRGDFLRGPDGAIEWLRVGARIHRRS